MCSILPPRQPHRKGRVGPILFAHSGIRDHRGHPDDRDDTMAPMRQRFEGFIAGVGSTSGIRVVVGHWPRSPFGSFTDAMVERADGRRTLDFGRDLVEPPYRVRMQRQITIRPDTDWQSHLTNFQKALCWFLAGWKARQYGYTSQPVTPAQNVPIGGHNLAGPHFVHSRQTLADSVVSRSETER